MPPEYLNARAAALRVFSAVVNQGRPLDDALDGDAGLAALSARDRNFARRLVATTLRRLNQIDALIDHCLERPLPQNVRPVRDLLRIGTGQLLFAGTPPHAAIDTTVRLAAKSGHGPHKNLINAVLRRLGREGQGLVDGQDAARLNTPGWLWRSWRDAYGEDTCRRIAEAHLGEAPLDIAVTGDAVGWAERLGAEILPGGVLRRWAGGAIAELPGYTDGEWWVQDAAAQMVSGLLGDVSGKRVIDLCAAPGGKTAALASRGARVIAVDRSERRLARLSANLKRLGLSAEVVAGDAAEWRPAEAGDAVLLDAPCSATGTIRRHPDIPHLKSASDVENLAAVQTRLLDAAVDMVEPGGRIIFCTCSLQPEEGPEQTAALLARSASLTMDPVSAREIGGLDELIAIDGAFRSLPCHLAPLGGIDGFYAVRLRKA